MYNNLYCKVYLNTELEIEELYQYINSRVLGELEPIRTIKTNWGELDLRRNSDFDFRRLRDNPEDFVFWQYYLDIEPMDGINELNYIGYISKLLDELSSLNIKSVASCDFEQDL
ncbi:MAG: 1,4-dihydroxy-6-naphthoate synthase [Lachnospiraceae bacterium]|nr:1,4-dihydroxy-6-naphthoate synthase [Lachnospiraceae bacterium]